MCEMYVKQVERNCCWLMLIRILPSYSEHLGKKTGIKGFRTVQSLDLKTGLLVDKVPFYYLFSLASVPKKCLHLVK